MDTESPEQAESGAGPVRPCALSALLLETLRRRRSRLTDYSEANANLSADPILIPTKVFINH